MDLSIISLAKVVPAVVPLLVPGGRIACLVKPQFEAGREAVGKGGIVRDESVRRRVIDDTIDGLCALGLELEGIMDCSTHGARGNREAVALLRTPVPPSESR